MTTETLTFFFIMLKGAGIVVYDSKTQRILLVQTRGYYKWGPPKGGIEIDESPHDCAVRELHEETGLSLVSGKKYRGILCGDYYIYIVPLDHVEGTICIYDTSEISKCEWFGLNAVSNIARGSHHSNRILRTFCKNMRVMRVKRARIYSTDVKTRNV